VISAVSQFWVDFSMPDYLQLDNELSFRGSNRHPRSFGSLIRLALSEKITPVFIPLAEPWRNGVIEKFNDNVQRYFLNTQNFFNLKSFRIVLLSLCPFIIRTIAIQPWEGKHLAR